MKIPRIFHRIWLGKRPMPPDFVAFGRGWERLHPGWEMRLWTEERLPPLTNRWAYRHAATLSGRANILRYEILLRFGGVYVDTDFECRRNLEPLLRKAEAFAGVYQEEKWEHGRFRLANNAILGAVPRHPFVADLVAEVEAQMRVMGAETPVSAILSGPLFLSSVLLRHPEVKLFPKNYFYPYGPDERWRRKERFPKAYAVHHWTLTGLSGLAVDGRRISSTGRPCLAIAVLLAPGPDLKRLEWVLEGLCEQTVTDFEVLVPGTSASVRQLLRRFRSRLVLRALSSAGSGKARSQGSGFAASREAARGGPSPRGGVVSPANEAYLVAGTCGWRAQALAAARAPRVLFLDGDCLPDPDVVARHAVQADRPVLLYGCRRQYPAAKFFPFREAVDYASIQQHARRPKPPRSVEAACFSVPRDVARSIPQAGSVREVALRLAEAGCPSSPSLFGGTVTQFLRS